MCRICCVARLHARSCFPTSALSVPASVPAVTSSNRANVLCLCGIICLACCQQQPVTHNALSGDIIEGISGRLADLTGSDEGGNLRAVFLKASGGKTFCAGGDLKAMKVRPKRPKR